jgi:type I restriction enzyme R subunit
MSKLLDDLIKQSRADTAAYEEFLRKAEDLVKRLAAKQPEAGIPAVLHGNPEAVALFNNLASIPATSFRYPIADEDRAELALKIDLAVRERAPAGWYGDQAREAQVLNALFPILDRDREATLALFEIVKNQPGYL